MQLANYIELADEVVGEIRAGTLRPGDRLPPQREFAQARRIAVSTAQRVYAELSRRGVVSGEIGRGTFVRLAARVARPALAEPTLLQADLDLNFRTVSEQDALLSASLAELMRWPDECRSAFAPASARGTRDGRQDSGRQAAGCDRATRAGAALARPLRPTRESQGISLLAASAGSVAG